MKMKRRSPNFSSGEVSLLIDLVHKHWKTLESKKSDTLVWKQKQQCWEDLTTEFNRLNQSNEHRQVTVLKKKWDNIKKNIKHKFATENSYVNEPNSFLSNSTSDYDEFELRTLGLLNVEAQYGCDVTSDDHTVSDVELMQDEFSNSLSPNHTPSTSSTKNSWDDCLPDKPITSVHQTKVMQKPLLSNNASMIMENSKKEAIEKNKNFAKTARSKIWHDISDENFEVRTLKKAKIELELKNMKEKHELEIKILKYELEIKKKMLENLTKQ